MAERSERAGRALRAFGELGWFRIPHTTNVFHGYEQLAFLGWRHKDPTNDMLDLFERVAAQAPKNLEWVFDSSRRNWLLIPDLLSRENLSATGRSFNEMVREITDNEQDYCHASNVDLEAIISLLESSGPVSR